MSDQPYDQEKDQPVTATEESLDAFMARLREQARTDADQAISQDADRDTQGWALNVVNGLANAELGLAHAAREAATAKREEATAFLLQTLAVLAIFGVLGFTIGTIVQAVTR